MKLSKLPVFCCALCILFTGCARIADPRPPERRVPEAVRDLNARQIAGEIVLTFSLPERNTDGSPARTIRSLEIFRIAEKAEMDAGISTDSADISEESFLSRAAHIFSIPAARFQEYTRGNIFVVRDALSAAGESPCSFRFRYAAVFVNEKNQAAGLGRQAVIHPMVLPPAPEGLAAVVTENEIRVAWTRVSKNTDGAQMPVIAGYNVYRSEKPDAFPAEPVNDAPIQAAEYRDCDFQFDKDYYYAVSVAVDTDPPAESARSEIMKVEARDIFPPLPPGNFTAVAENGRVTLFWTPSPSVDVAGYRVFRKNRTAGGKESESRQPLPSDGPITGISWRDENVEPDGDYIYEIQAVDGHGNASETVRFSVKF